MALRSVLHRAGRFLHTPDDFGLCHFEVAVSGSWWVAGRFCIMKAMEIEFTEVRQETYLRLLRISLVRFVAWLCRVPMSIRDEFYGSVPGNCR